MPNDEEANEDPRMGCLSVNLCFIISLLCLSFLQPIMIRCLFRFLPIRLFYYTTSFPSLQNTFISSLLLSFRIQLYICSLCAGVLYLLKQPCRDNGNVMVALQYFWAF